MPENRIQNEHTFANSSRVDLKRGAWVVEFDYSVRSVETQSRVLPGTHS